MKMKNDSINFDEAISRADYQKLLLKNYTYDIRKLMVELGGYNEQFD